MNFRESSQEVLDPRYKTKRVVINGQFVTLYSSNGQTWVSSPEDIPALMERLENAQISLSVGEKPTEGAAAVAKPGSPVKTVSTEDKEPDSGEAKGSSQRVLQTKYRVKGPKPRPILRQGGVVIQGTPIEPISASSATMSFSSDIDSKNAKGGEKGPAKSSANKGKFSKANSGAKRMIAPVLEKPAGAKARELKAVGKSASIKKDADKKVGIKRVKEHKLVEEKAKGNRKEPSIKEASKADQRKNTKSGKAQINKLKANSSQVKNSSSKRADAKKTLVENKAAVNKNAKKSKASKPSKKTVKKSKASKKK